MSWFPTGTDLAYRTTVYSDAPDPLYVYHTSGFLSVIPGNGSTTGVRRGKVKFSFGYKSPNVHGEELLTPSNPDVGIDIRSAFSKMLDRFKQYSDGCNNRAIAPDTQEANLEILYSDDQYDKIFLIRSLGIVCSFNRSRLLERLGNEGFVLSSPLQKDPEVAEYTQSSCAIHRVFYKDSTGRFSSLWTTMAGQTVSIPNQNDFDGADGLYHVVIVNGEKVCNAAILFDEFATQSDMVKKLQEMDVHPSEYDCVQGRTTKQIQAKLDSADKVIIELEKTKEELRKAKLEIEELKYLRTREREKTDDLKIDGRKNGILEWLKAVMSWFGIEIKRFIFGKLLFC